MNRTMSSANSESFLFFFFLPTWISFYLFIYLSIYLFIYLFLLWLLWLGLPKQCWRVVVRVGNLVLFLILEEMLSTFHHWRFSLLVFPYTAFTVLQYVPFTLVFWRLIIKKCWILSKFLCIYWDNHVVFNLWVYYSVSYWLVDLQKFKFPCILGVNPTCL